MAGFAGSQRIDERRRRRLATGAEPVASGSSRSTGRGDPLQRFFSTGGREGACLTTQNCPLVSLISVHEWRHWLFAAILALLAGGALLAGVLTPRWQPVLGEELIGFTSLSTGPLLGWCAQGLMLLAAQSAAVVWWGRSRSTKDFSGNYRIWSSITATWLVYGFCLGTGAHWIAADVCLRIVPWSAPGARLWCWAVPACVWGWAIGLRIDQELTGCSRSRSVFYLAAFSSLAALLLQFQRALAPQMLSQDVSLTALWVTTLLSLVGLVLAMNLYARHVLYFTADPNRRAAPVTPAADATAPRRTLWQRVMSLFFRTKAATASSAEESTATTTTGKRKTTSKAKKKPAAKRTRRKPAPVEEEYEEEAADESETAEEESSEGWETEGADEKEALGDESGADEGWEEEESAEEESEAEYESAPAASGRNYRVDAPAGGVRGPHFASADETEDDEESGEDPYAGMSRKQRKRLQQQQSRSGR